MRITFAGVGEAFDEHLPNTSILFRTEAGSLLADCGFTAASAFWRAADNPMDLDGLYISHFHGDHFFGVPALLVRYIDGGRTAPLTIYGQPGVEEHVLGAMELAYAGTLAKSGLQLQFVECSPDSVHELKDMRLRFAYGDHPKPCLGLRVDSGDLSAFYSGDGRSTDETVKLATGCTLVVHESFSLEPDTPGHGTVASSMEFANRVGAKGLALVHMNRKVRRAHGDEVLALVAEQKDMQVFLPMPGDSVELCEL